MYNYRFRRLFLALTLLVASYELLATKCSAEETLTITTYYPSPYGSYNELRTYRDTYLATDGGSVGIGTVNPEAGVKLEVIGPIESSSSDGPTTNGVAINAGNSTSGANANRIRWGGNDTNANRFSFQGIGDVEYMVIKDGRVGIGTDTPVGKVMIQHQSGVNPFAGASLQDPHLRLYETKPGGEYARIQLDNNGSNFWHIAGIVDDGNSANSRLNFYYQNTGNILSIIGNGSVGIGTVNPEAGVKLEAIGPIESSSSDGPTTNGVAINAGNSTSGANANRIRWGGNDTNANRFSFQGIGDVEYMVIKDGNVGIGTADPKAGLHVADKGLYVGSLAPANTSTVWIIAGSSATASGPGLHRNYGIAGTGINAGVYGDVVVDPMVSFGGNKGALGYSYMPGGGAPWFSTGVYGEKVGTDTNNYAGYFNGPVYASNLEINGGIAFNKGLVYGPDNYQTWGVFRKVRLNAPPWPKSYIEIETGDGNLYGIDIWSSSGKAKRNITDLEIDSSRIYQLRPVSFNWKGDPEDANRSFGLIAEEAAEVLPELVTYDEKNSPHHISYPLLSVLNLNELKKLHEKETVTTKKLNKLFTKVESQQKEIEVLKKEIKQLREKKR